MTRARDIMTAGADFLSESDTLLDAARRMAETGVGALPVCRTSDKHLVGMVTDRDIVVRGLAANHDPADTRVADLVQEQPEVSRSAPTTTRTRSCAR
jgi:CBS domain-containing protein